MGSKVSIGDLVFLKEVAWWQQGGYRPREPGEPHYKKRHTIVEVVKVYEKGNINIGGLGVPPEYYEIVFTR